MKKCVYAIEYIERPTSSAITYTVICAKTKKLCLRQCESLHKPTKNCDKI